MMSFSGLCQYFSEIAFYLATVRYVFAIIAPIQAVWPLMAIFLAAGVISAFFGRFEGFKAYLPMLLTIPAFAMAKSAADVVCTVPLALLLFCHIRNRRWHCDSELLRSSLKAGLGVFMFILVIAAASGNAARLSAEAIPVFVLFMALVILGLRVARNEESGKTGPLFYFLNTAVVALVTASGFIFSSSALLNTVKLFFRTLYEKIIGPLLMGATYVLIAIPLALGWMLEKLELEPKEEQAEALDGMLNQVPRQDQIFENITGEDVPQWLPKLFAAVGFAVFLAICFFVIRALVGRYSSGKSSGGRLVRERAEEEDAPRRRRFGLRKTPDDSVRACYRKYLDICNEYSIPTDGSIASDEIASRSESFAGEEPANGLRRLWLPARYSLKSSVTEDDAKQAKRFLRDIKKEAKEKNVYGSDI